MAIAFDAKAESSVTSTSLTYSHTCTGSNLILWVGVVTYGNALDHVTGVTYNGVAMTRTTNGFNNNSASGPAVYLYYLVNPSTGANNVVISVDSSRLIIGLSASYTGAAQSGQPDNSATNQTASGTSLSVSLTTVADNCWLVGMMDVNNGTALTAGANTTLRQQDTTSGQNSNGLFDSNGAKTPAGSYSLACSWTSAQRAAMCIASFSPAGAAATTHSLPLLGVGS